MDRDTKEIKVGKHSFVVKTYATAREAATIQEAYFKGSKMELVGQEAKLSEFNPNVGFEVQLEMIKQMVVSIDGTPDDIVTRAENLPSDWFDELTATLDALIAKKRTRGLSQSVQHGEHGREHADARHHAGVPLDLPAVHDDAVMGAGPH